MPTTISNNQKATSVGSAQMTIDCNERIFAVWGQKNANYNPILCNLSELAGVCDRFPNPVIKHFWNGSLKSISRKEVNTMLSANGLEHL